MKRIIKLSILSCFIFIVGYLIYQIVEQLQQKKETLQFTQTLQPFKILNVHGDRQLLDPASGRKMIFFFFNTECDHCQAEAKLIRRELRQLKKTNIYFISTESIETIRAFGKTYDLLVASNVTLGQIDGKEVFEKFGVNTFPMVFIYSEDGKLLKKYTGEVKIEAITKYL